MGRSKVVYLAAGFALAFAVSCSDSPVIPNPPPSGNNGNTGPPATPRITTIAIGGQQTVTIGSTTQLVLTAYQSNGTSRNATGEATWTSAHPSVTVSGGSVTATTQVETTISATLEGFTSSFPMVAIPEGSFRISGIAFEKGLGIGVPSATIQVVAGSSAGLTTTTDAGGLYKLYVLGGETTVVAKRSGYRDDIKQVVVSVPNQRVDFELIAGGSIEVLEGSYALTIAASESCRQNLPNEARVRTYAADVTQSRGRLLSMRLSDATFVYQGYDGSLFGRIDIDGVVTFDLRPYYDEFPELIERVGTNQLWFGGIVTARVSGDRISGTLSGPIELRGDSVVRLATCSASDHTFELRRR